MQDLPIRTLDATIANASEQAPGSTCTGASALLPCRPGSHAAGTAALWFGGDGGEVHTVARMADFTRRLIEAHPETVVVLVSIEDPDELADEVTAGGAVAFLHKRDPRPATLRDVWANYGDAR
jgi:hypothetical protein